LLLFGIVSVNSILFASPTLIQDNRVTNLGSTPVLGRGYSVATNTYQSTCLKDIQTTEPSYDFSYSFQQMENFLATISGDSENQLMQLANASFINGLTKESDTTENADGSTPTVRKSKEIVVDIKIDTYYASVDESKTQLSDTAAKLITSNDIPGFFSSCGSYYIRSIRRNALFISVFKFESTSTAEDKEFIYQLESELKGFRKEIIGKDEKQESAQNENNTAVATSSTESSIPSGTTNTSFSSFAKSHNLTITAAAFGLGKSDKTTLISYDIDSFKAAIKDAFLAMQSPKTGKVTSIEVVPWVENTEFQTLMKLDQDSEGYRVSVKDGKPEPDTGSKLLIYEKKHNLNQNAEFLAELERADRAMMNVYYKAKICKKHIETNWKHLQDGKRVFKDVFAKRYVMNNNQPKVGVELTQLDGALTKEKIDSLLQAHRQFMYGGGGWGEGAAVCMRQLLEFGIFRINYRSLPSCATLEENLMQIEEEIIENHCMPVLFKSNYIPSDTTSSN